MKLDKRVRWEPSADLALDIAGKQIVIIGGTGGIGRALSRHLAAFGASVTVVGQTFRDLGEPRISFLKADLSLMSESRRIADILPAETLDLLIFTTGIFAAPQRQETMEGIERDLAVSYLNRFVILRAIASRLGKHRSKEGGRPRVFLMGYPGSGQVGNVDDLNAEKSYKAMSAHMNTVAGNEMLVLDAAQRYQNATYFGLNPGLIKTNIRDNFLGKNTLKSRLIETSIGWLTPTADAYAKRISPLLLAQRLENYSGAMFNAKGQAILPSNGLTEEHIHRFLTESESLVIQSSIVRSDL